MLKSSALQQRTALTFVAALAAIVGASECRAAPTPQVRLNLPAASRRINWAIRQQWQEYQSRPSPPATDREWCRRLYLDVLGRIPTVAEVGQFMRDRTPNRRQSLVRKLLYDEEHTSEYARNWSTIWSNLLIGRGGGTEPNSPISRGGMRKYLRDAFAENRRYDRIVHELVTAEGGNTPGSEGFNGATNFLMMKLEDRAVEASAETSKLFLGQQIQCTQCHDHPFNHWKQNQFWEFSAFFRQAVRLQQYEPMAYFQLTDQDFAGEQDTPTEAEVYFETREQVSQVAYPRFVDGTELANRSGLLRDVHRREELAKMMLESDELPRTIVNRMWAHFLGFGFTTPVDDMGPHNPPTHPKLLKYLAKEFVAHSYDLKQLVEWIVLSRPYGLSSRAALGTLNDPLPDGRPLFSRFYLRQMRPEELYESLLVAAGRDQTRGSLEDQVEAQEEWLRQFTIQFGTDEADETTTFDGSITQMLMLFNGDLVRDALSTQPGSVLHHISQMKAKFPGRLNYLYQSAFARNPTVEERALARRLVLMRNGREDETMQDLWWAVLNSNEFILNH